MVPVFKLTQEPVMLRSRATQGLHTEDLVLLWFFLLSSSPRPTWLNCSTLLMWLFKLCCSGEHAHVAVFVPGLTDTGWRILPGPTCVDSAQRWRWHHSPDGVDCVCQVTVWHFLPRQCIKIWEHEMKDSAVWAVASQICFHFTAHWRMQQV